MNRNRLMVGLAVAVLLAFILSAYVCRALRPPAGRSATTPRRSRSMPGSGRSMSADRRRASPSSSPTRNTNFPAIAPRPSI